MDGGLPSKLWRATRSCPSRGRADRAGPRHAPLSPRLAWDAGTGATHRVVKRLVAAGLVRERVEGRQKYYQADPASPVFEELVVLVRKAVGLAAPLRVALAQLGDRVHAAFVYGSVAAGAERAESHIDLMVIADDLDYPTLFEALSPLERQLGRAVNPNLMTLSEWVHAASALQTALARRKPVEVVLSRASILGGCSRRKRTLLD